MAIDIFISRPTTIARRYEQHYESFKRYLSHKGYRLRRLGGDDYTMDASLKAVISLMKQCKGAIILGYPQYEVSSVVTKGGTAESSIGMMLPTPWNQIEATLAFQQKIPVLVVAQRNVTGGVFDYGVTGEYVLMSDLGKKNWFRSSEFQGVFNEWQKRI